MPLAPERLELGHEGRSAFLSGALTKSCVAFTSCAISSRRTRLWSSRVRYSGKSVRSSSPDENVSASAMTLCW